MCIDISVSYDVLTLSHALTSPFIIMGDECDWVLCSDMASTLPHGDAMGLIFFSSFGDGKLV
jgi:hypothetical protein